MATLYFGRVSTQRPTLTLAGRPPTEILRMAIEVKCPPSPFSRYASDPLLYFRLAFTPFHYLIPTIAVQMAFIKANHILT